MIQKVNRWIDSVFSIQSDSELIKARKRIVISMVLISIPFAIGFSLFFFTTAEYFLIPGLIVLLYVSIAIANIFYLAYWKRFTPFVWIMIIAIFIMSTGIHIVQGGFFKSSGTIMYALIAPAVATTGINRKAGALVLVLYIAAIITLFIFQPQIEHFGPPEITDLIILVLLAINLCATGFFIFGTLLLLISETGEALSKADNLLLNILPFETARELKKKGSVDPRTYTNVSVLFSDFVSFTKVSARLNPEELVKKIDLYYTAFDEIVNKYGLEKIKTIGDSYMCAGGIPIETKGHEKDIVYAAKEMLSFVKQIKRNSDESEDYFEIRIGIHTGPVVAGIVGSIKWQYDIWGDTVNIASRMESNSKPMNINVSETCYSEAKNDFEFTTNGDYEMKSGQRIKMFLLQ